MDEQVTVTPTAPATKDSMLSLKGLAEVFYNPRAFFTKLIDQPKILVPYLVLGVLYLVTFYFARDLVWDMISTSPKFIEQTQNSPASMEQIRKFTLVWFVGGTWLAMMVAPLLAALLGLFWGNFVFAGKATYSQLLSIMLFGEVIYAVGAVINLGLALIRGSLGASLSLGVFAAGQGLDSLAFVALSKIAVFLIWEIIAIGIGMSILYKTKASRGYVLAILSMGMLSILQVLFTAIGKMFQG
jgi:hypothetical protein